VITEERARELVAEISVSVDGIRDRLVELYDGRGWLALGYGTWADMCETEFGSVAVGRLLPREQRRELVGELTEAGMSTRAIGTALGVPDRTARRDAARGTSGPPASNVVGLDGKTYRPPSPEAERRAAERRAAEEIERGIRDTNVHVAEAVHLLAWQTPDTFLRDFYPRHQDTVATGMQLTRERCLAARTFLNRVLEREDLP
jgi:hypothetical protein